MYSNSNYNLAFNEINTSLNKIYKYLNNPRTEEFGNELFKNLIMKYISQNTLIFSIINSLEEKIKKMISSNISPYINLLSYFFDKNIYDNSLCIYLPYLNPILSIIQSLIIEKSIKFLSQIPEIFMKIVQNLTPDDITASNKYLKDYEKKIYDILQNFCFYNLKNEQKINQVIGSLCLTKLVENCPYVLKDEYIQIIIDEILLQLSLENFEAKQELLNCLISLILGAENLFKPYAKIVFNKIIDFLTNDNWIERKLSLNIIYTLVFYCKDEMISLKENILNIINILQNDKVKEIRDICLLIKSMFEKDKKEKNNLQSKSKNNSVTKNNKNQINKRRNNHLSSGNIISKIGQINYIKYNNISPFSPNRNTKNKLQNLKITKLSPVSKTNIEKENNKLTTSKNTYPRKPKRKKPSVNLNSSDINQKNQKHINKTKNFSFVNEKMIIRPDPKKSIFNSHKNMAFFKQNNNSDSKNKNLIIISSKDDNNNNNIKKNFNTSEGFYIKENNMTNSVNDSETGEKKKDKENNLTLSNKKENYTNENKEKIDKDYENNKDNINNLIALDEIIKKENIKKIENNSIHSSNDKTQSFQSFQNIEHKHEVQNKNKNNKENLIKTLLSEVRELSNKQISLLDLMDEIQSNTQNQIEELNSKIINLDDTIKELNEQLYILQNEQ